MKDEIDDVEVSCDTSTFDLECTLQSLNIDFGIIAGVYIYANKDGKIDVTKIGTEKHTDILESEYYKHIRETKCQD